MERARDRAVDDLLVMRCQSGGREAFDLLFRRWQRPLWRYARRLTGSDEAAWDVMQDSWIAIIRRIRRLSDPAWFAAWAYRIVRNKCADHGRRSGREQRLARAAAVQGRRENEPCRQDAGRALARAMQQLPADSREVLALKYGGDLNIVEIALVLGVPAGTVKSRLHHARERLRRTLEGAES